MNISQVKSLFLISAVLFLSPLNAMSGYNYFDIFTSFWARTQGEPTISRHAQQHGGLMPLPPLEKSENEACVNNYNRAPNYHLKRASVFNHLRMQELGQSAIAKKMLQKLNSQLEIKIRELTEEKMQVLEKRIKLNTIRSLTIKGDREEANEYHRFCLKDMQINLIVKYFPALSTLSLRYTGMNNEGFKVLANSSIAPYLLELDISQNKITYIGFTTDQLNNFKNLRVLNASCNALRDNGFVILSNSSVAPQLVTLNLDTNGITSTSFTSEQLNKFTNLQNLILHEPSFVQRWSTVPLKRNAIGDEGFKALANSSIAANIIELNIGLNQISETGFTSNLLNKFSSLKKLCVNSNELGFHGLLELGRSALACTLTTLDFGGNFSRIFDDKLLLWVFNQFSNLEKLCFNANRLTSKGFYLLACSKLASRLIELNIDHNYISQIEDEIIPLLNRFTKLRKLDIEWNELGDKDFIALAESALAGHLVSLSIGHNNITKRAFNIYCLNKFTALEVIFIKSELGEDVTLEIIMERLAASKLANQLRIINIRHLHFSNLYNRLREDDILSAYLPNARIIH